MQTIPFEDLISMDKEAAKYGFRVELAYARDDNLLFGEAIYSKGAQLWLHKDLAKIVFGASELASDQGYRLVLYDGLRPVEAQEAMLKTKAVQQNPHWLQEPRLLSPPGAGAHPRGMAIDCSLETLDGELLDMGTAFDYLAEDPSPAHNPAHRAYQKLSDLTAKNRTILDSCMFKAARACDVPLEGLAQEWWDFRLPKNVYEHFLSIETMP